MNLGVCYYPEHWPRERWAEDARRMKELGLRYVRIGEFSWSRLEPNPGQLEWEWLDAALQTLGGAGLEVVLGTPTATPPKWLIDQHPEILALDKEGRPRGFGSRRHYSFSSPVYWEHSQRIVEAMASRYGQHPAVAGWQTDNEYGCHDTVRSYAPADRSAFQNWLAQKYGDIKVLNQAWGNVFWSMEYRSFAEVELPNLTVTEANPSQWLDYHRFASDQVVAYNQMQVQILRAHSPGRFITHNFMGFVLDFDHFKLTQDLDLASWDSYPLGFTDQSNLPEEVKLRYARTGHPDIAAFHHDLYRGVGRGRWWVMEQQPGPVNWAAHNPSPAAGVVRLWTWEALAHGAETVSYFRWRQFPQAQEQMHAGLNRPDFAPDVAYFEAKQVAEEIPKVRQALQASQQADVALVFDYQADWLFKTQPQGQEFSYVELVFQFYSSLRQLGLNIDFVPPGASLQGYKMAVVPSLPMVSPAALEAFQNFEGQLLLGPRSGSKTEHLGIPANLPPGPLQALLPLKVVRVESLRPAMKEKLVWSNRQYTASLWKEWVESELSPVGRFNDDRGAIYAHQNRHYLACWPSPELLMSYLEYLALVAGVPINRLPEGLRIRRNGNLMFAFNHTGHLQPAPASEDAEFVMGGVLIKPYGVSVWKV